MGIRDRLRRLVRSPPPKPSEHRWLLDLTTHRDVQIYQPEFGRPYRMSIVPAPLSRLHAVVPEVDPRWEHTGVYAYPPSTTRPHWLQVTAGLSNPWHGPLPPPEPPSPEQARSGAGIELCLLTPEREEWAADILNALMARQQCVAAGQIPGSLLQPGDVLSAEGLTMPRGTPPPASLRVLAVVAPVGLPAGFVLPYGRVEWRMLVGLSDPGAPIPQDGITRLS